MKIVQATFAVLILLLVWAAIPGPLQDAIIATNANCMWNPADNKCLTHGRLCIWFFLDHR